MFFLLGEVSLYFPDFFFLKAQGHDVYLPHTTTKHADCTVTEVDLIRTHTK